MTFEYLETNIDGMKIFARIDDDGLCRYTCTEDDPQYQVWLHPELQNNGGLN
jgi:hypothetical protein